MPVIYKFNVKGRLLIKEAISGDADKVFAMKLLNGWHPREDTGCQTRRHQRDYPVKENRCDIDEIKPEYLKGVTFHYVADIQEVIGFVGGEGGKSVVLTGMTGKPSTAVDDMSRRLGKLSTTIVFKLH